MMAPETLVRHEIVGLDVEVIDAPNADLVGVAGRVVDETEQTVLVSKDDGTDEVAQVPKAGTTFRFALDSDADDGSEEHDNEPRSSTNVLVDGDRLVARPARRTERTGGSPWQ